MLVCLLVCGCFLFDRSLSVNLSFPSHKLFDLVSEEFIIFEVGLTFHLSTFYFVQIVSTWLLD